MKKVLFVGYNMEMGGAENALINVLNLIKDKCEIDLLLLEKKGVLIDKIPNNVNIIEVKTNIFKYALFRFIPFIRKIIVNSLANKEYDLAVAFMEGRAATIITDLKCKCKKVAWIHNDVSKFDIGIREKEINRSYNLVDLVVVVSEHSRDSFVNKFKIDKDKVLVVYNLIDEKEILQKSKEFLPKKETFTFVNVAKMRIQKRHDRLIEAAKILKEEGHNFQVWLIGNGPEEDKIKELIKKYNLEDCVICLGLKTNPYPYIKVADYFVLSSDHEGYPLTLLEALLLKTKIISTDVSGAREMLKDNHFGFVVDISVEALTDKMREVMVNPQISKAIDTNLKRYKGSNEQIKQQLLDIFELKD